MSEDLFATVSEDWRKRVGWARLNDEQRKAVADFGMYSFSLGRYTVDDIDDIKYDGKLVILDDGSRWEVDSSDAYEAESWLPLDKVVVIDDVMYNIENAPHVDVTEEY